MPPRKAAKPGHAPRLARPWDQGRGASRGRRPDRVGPPPDTAPARGAPRLTGRGAVLLICVLSFAGTMVAHAVPVPAVPGLAFTAACTATASLVRPSDLLSLSVSPPIAYFVAVTAAEVLMALGHEGFSRVLLLGLASRLAEIAPWLFLGTALVLIIGVFRGLPGNIRELNDRFNGR
ncbi:DUF6542 domain-containing protein [Nocardiopsis sp. LOL_012]|uniref:DUF6542 domain-containing protein n=1 Tax=Nocardiopsis sp. LOL_012 TaxID=3345409 RepID=UPI003A8C2B75